MSDDEAGHFRVAHDFQNALCEVLGIDPKVTSRIVIDVDASIGPVSVTIHQWTTTDKENAIIRAFEVTDRREVTK